MSQDVWRERVGQAGADVLRISETTVLVAVDEVLTSAPWCHPAWPLCRGLGALGFELVELRGAEDDAVEFSHLMEGFAFAHGPALDPGEPTGPGAPADIVLHLGSDRHARAACAQLARSGASHFAGLCWGPTWVEMHAIELTGGETPGSVQPSPEPLAPLARVTAGLALQEALVVAGGLDEAAPPEPRVCFDATGESRTAGAERGSWPPVCIEAATLEVVGAGAVGTQLLECLLPLLGAGCEVRIFDPDRVGPENLSMQPTYSPEDVGEPKAAALAEKLLPLCHPGVEVRPMVLRYEDRPDRLGPPSLRLVCPDSFAARSHANARSLADGVPLVEAGSSPLVAQQRTYLPDRTACLEHRIPHLSRRAADEQRPESCSAQRALTLPGTNMICGGLLATEALRALAPTTFGTPSRGTVVYDARFPQRFGVVDVRPPCSHGSRARKREARAARPKS